MSLPLPTLLTALAHAQSNEVAPALQLLGQPGAPDANYAGGTAATSALILIIAAAETAARPAREAVCADAARALIGSDAIGRDARAAALGSLLAGGDRTALALLKAEAAAEWEVLAGLALPLPVPVE